MKTKCLTFSKGLIIIMLLVVSGFFILVLNRRQALGRELISILPMQGEPSFYIGEDAMKLCECGCGQEVAREGNRFIHGHNYKGKNNPMYGVHRKGKNNPMYKHKHTEETKKKQSEVTKGKNNPMYGVHLKGKDAPMYGKHHTEETKKKQSKAKKGKKRLPFTKEHCKNLSESRIQYMQNHNSFFKPTSIEIKMEDELKKSGLNYQKQFYIKMVGIVDFFLPEYRIIIECDGDYWHNLSGARQNDSNRDFMATFGDRYEVVRFWEHEINESSEKCMKRLFKVIKKRKRGA